MDTVDTMGAAGDALRLMVPTISLEAACIGCDDDFAHAGERFLWEGARDDFALYVRRYSVGAHRPHYFVACHLPTRLPRPSPRRRTWWRSP